MTFATLFPELVHQLVSIDMPPLDRNKPEFKSINDNTEKLIDTAYSILCDLSNLGVTGIPKALDVTDPKLCHALKSNINPDASLSVNIEALYHNKHALFGYPSHGRFYGPTLFINGENSFQKAV